MDFTSFPVIPHSCSQDPILVSESHLIVLHLWVSSNPCQFLSLASSSFFDTFEEYWLVVLWNDSQSGCSWWFHMIIMRLCMSGKDTWELLEHTPRGQLCRYIFLVMLTSITWLRWCLSGFSTVKVTIFPSDIVKYFGEDTLVYLNILLLPSRCVPTLFDVLLFFSFKHFTFWHY